MDEHTFQTTAASKWLVLFRFWSETFFQYRQSDSPESSLEVCDVLCRPKIPHPFSTIEVVSFILLIDTRHTQVKFSRFSPARVIWLPVVDTEVYIVANDFFFLTRCVINE